LRFDMPTREEVLIAGLAKVMIARCDQQPSTEWLCGRQKGIWRFLENTLVLCWRAGVDEKERLHAIQNEMEKIRMSIPEVLSTKPIAGALSLDRLTVNCVEGSIGKGEQDDWLVLLAKAITINKGLNL